MIEKQISISTGQERLAATLCLPAEQGVFTTVLMVHGSGKLDRDSNATNFKLNLFKPFAHALAKIGVASLRYDKRGIGNSTGDFYKTGHFDLVDDAHVCLEYLAASAQCDAHSLFVLGHSEGTIIAAQVAQRSPMVAGIILLTPFIDKIESVLTMQARGLKHASRKLTGIKGWMIRSILRLFDPVKTQARVVRRIKKTRRDYVYFMFRKIPAKWLRELMSRSPERIYKATHCPCLIIGGSKDVQCHPDDVDRIAAILPGKVESHLIQNMSHLLRHEPGDASVFNYKKQLGLPIEPKVMALISHWIVSARDKKPV